MDIIERNRLRAEAHLPLLDAETEERQLAAASGKAEFEAEWARRRTEFAPGWSGNGAGWVANMGRYGTARRKVREEMQ